MATLRECLTLCEASSMRYYMKHVMYAHTYKKSSFTYM